MKRTKLVKTVAASLCLVTVMGANVFANSAYKGYELKARQTNVYTPPHTKQLNDDCTWNHVQRLDGTTRVTSWSCNGDKKQISNDYYLGKNEKARMAFTSGNLKKGDNVRIGMENYYSTKTSTAYVGGEMDFR